MTFLDDGVGGVGDEGGGGFGFVDFEEVLLDLAHAEAARVEADNAVVEAVKLALVLGHEGGLEAAVAVAGDLDGDLAVVAAQGFRAVTVAGVGRAFGRSVVFIVAEVGGELGVRDAVDETLLEFGEQAVGAKQVAGLVVVFEQLAGERVGDGWFDWDVLFG